MNELLFALSNLTGTLALAFLFGGYISFADDEEEKQRSGVFELSDFLFGGICRVVSNWNKKKESRMCIYSGLALGILSIALLILSRTGGA